MTIQQKINTIPKYMLLFFLLTTLRVAAQRTIVKISLRPIKDYKRNTSIYQTVKANEKDYTVNKKNYQQFLIKNFSFQRSYIPTNCSNCDSKIGIFIGRGDSITDYIVDINQNKNFSDDRIYQFPNTFLDTIKNGMKLSSLMPTLEVSYRFCIRGKCTLLKDSIVLIPFKTLSPYGDSLEQKLFLQIGHIFGREGILPGGRRVMLNATMPDFSDAAVCMNIPMPNNTGTEKQFFIGDYIPIGKHAYKFLSVSHGGKEALLERYPAHKVIGGWPNLQAPDFIAIDLKGRQQALSQYKGQYVLLDFWGTWCQPCLANLPKLIKAYDNLVKKDVVLLGIVVDANKKKPLLPSISDSLGIRWPGIFEDMDRLVKTAIQYKFNVASFPTYILIDPTGRIVMREGSEGFEKILQYLYKKAK